MHARWLALWLLLALAAPAVALARMSLMSGGGFLFDVAEAADSYAGSLQNGSVDAYDTCYRLRVGGTEYDPTGATVVSVGGRQLELPAQTMSGISVRRLVYVPSSGGDYARYLEVLDNPTAADVTVNLEVFGNLGSDGSTVTTGTSSGDLTVDASDAWFATDDTSDGSGDPSLAHVVRDLAPALPPTAVSQTGDSISYTWTVTVPAMGRAVIMHFAVQTMNRAGSIAAASALIEPDDVALMGADAYLGDVLNFDVGFEEEPCLGLAELDACVDAEGVAGVCRDARCCTGCFDGTRCVSGRPVGSCGAGGGACASCVDGDACTDDFCTDGVCSNPDAASGTVCDDGLFCTRTDVCDGAGVCVGTGARCDDNESCTNDSCDETMDRCNHVGRGEGTACTVAGTAAGMCRGDRCCSGCFNGTYCVGGAHPSFCGVGGGLCASCVDGDPCTSDVCTAGVCSNPDAPSGTRCDDGLFCTALDTCDGAGGCSGTGEACDDGRGCTADSCDEGSRSCANTRTEGCLIGGSCVPAGAINPTYPCQECDPARDETDWSLRVAGASCGEGCAGGRIAVRTCDAMGECVAERTPCPTGFCADGRSCEAICEEGSCHEGDRCDTVTGHCVKLIDDGEACTRDLACESEHCVDGVCCASACDGLCERCNLDGRRGRCELLDRGRDPDAECPGLEVCDSAGACMEPVSEPRDAGVGDGGSAMDAGRRDAGPRRSDAGLLVVDAGSLEAPEDGGCACRAGQRGSPMGAALVLLGLVALAGWRRRRDAGSCLARRGP